MTTFIESALLWMFIGFFFTLGVIMCVQVGAWLEALTAWVKRRLK